MSSLSFVHVWEYDYSWSTAHAGSKVFIEIETSGQESTLSLLCKSCVPVEAHMACFGLFGEMLVFQLQCCHILHSQF